MSTAETPVLEPGPPAFAEFGQNLVVSSSQTKKGGIHVHHYAGFSQHDRPPLGI